MSKGCSRRPTELTLEEADIRWDITFAKTAEDKEKAIQKLAEFMQKRTYIEKRINK